MQVSILTLSCACSYDEHSHERFAPGDPGKRAFTYFVLTGGRFIYASALRLAVLKFILSMTVGCLAKHLGSWPMQSGSAFCDMLKQTEASSMLLMQLSCLQATKDVLAMASLEVDLSAIEPGNTITVKWRGKPVFIKHRTEEEIGKAQGEDITKLRDPEADDARAQKPEVTHFTLLLFGNCAADTYMCCSSRAVAGCIVFLHFSRTPQ